MVEAEAETASDGAERPIIEITGLNKWFGTFHVLRDIDLAVERRERIVICGPSGSGKSTLIRCINRLEEHQEGTVVVDGTELTHNLKNIDAIRREVGMVFQQFNLFPHLTVLENCALAPIWVRKMPKAEAQQIAMQYLERVKIPEQASKYPGQLSGGQQQRVAIARALVFEPELVLMDEPLGALDRRLREEMQYEIRRIHSRLGVTVVYVTHDQQEAMTLSDRVAVFHNGMIEQAAPPEVLYEEPEKAFVARFIGENNRLHGTVVSEKDGVCEVDVDGLLVRALSLGLCPPGAPATVVIRPERVAVSREPGRYTNEVETKIDDLIFLGDHLRVHMTVGGSSDFIAKIPNVVGHGAVLPGDTVRIGWASLDCRALAPEELAEGEEEW